jgi:precorrin-8X/cobalt-precorrin-8 methylmutase
MGKLDYIRDPEEIYRRSFAEIGSLEKIRAIAPELRAVATRIVHACGMPDIVDDLRWSDGAVAAGCRALEARAPVLCDVEMVRCGIIMRHLPEGVAVECRISEAATRDRAERFGITRAAAEVDMWGERLAGAVFVCGNAPTALFRLLENIDGGAAKPALILAFPVGFVGAAEAKAELARDARGVPFLTLLGRRGGSAIASAALNGIAAGLAI